MHAETAVALTASFRDNPSPALPERNPRALAARRRSRRGVAVPADLRQAHPHVQPARAPGAPAPRHVLCHRNPDPDEAARADERLPRPRHRNRRRRSRRAAEVRPGLLRPPRGQPALPAALLGRHARQPRPRRGGARRSRATTASTCGTASGRPTPRCCATRWGRNSPTRGGGHGPQRRVAHLAAVRRDRAKPVEAVVHPPAVAQVRAVRAVGVLDGDACPSPSATTTPS